MNSENINWLKIKWMQFRKTDPSSIFVNYTFDEANSLEIKTRQTFARRRPKKPELKPFYSSKLPISVDKKNDLRSLCATSIIPKVYHEYYENLQTANSVHDQLLESDEDDYDTDE